MAHGGPDWGVQQSVSTVHKVSDLGELAARLDSPDTFHRAGNVIFLESFEGGLGRWSATAEGTGGVADLTIGLPNHGLYAVRLLAGSDGNRQSYISRNEPYPALSIMGHECAFRLVTTATDRVELRIEHYDGTNLSLYAVRWRDTDNDLQYLDSTGTWVTITAAASIALHPTVYHRLKLLANLSTGRYTAVILDDTRHSLSGIAPQQAASTTAPNIGQLILNVGRAGQNDQVNIDNVILTQNEP